jgi:hypothetical protein
MVFGSITLRDSDIYDDTRKICNSYLAPIETAAWLEEYPAEVIHQHGGKE